MTELTVARLVLSFKQNWRKLIKIKRFLKKGRLIYVKGITLSHSINVDKLAKPIRGPIGQGLCGDQVTRVIEVHVLMCEINWVCQ